MAILSEWDIGGKHHFLHFPGYIKFILFLLINLTTLGAPSYSENQGGTDHTWDVWNNMNF